MASRIDFQATEQDFRRRWHRAHIDAFISVVGADTPSWRSERLDPHVGGANELIEELARARDLSAFQLGTDRWTRGFDSGYNGFAGQMTLNQLVKQSPDEDVAVTVLLDALTVPGDLADAQRKIRLLADHMVSISRKGRPSPARAPFVASYFWGIVDQRSWPVAWPKSMNYLEFVTGEPSPTDQGERYDRLYRFAMEMDGDPVRFEQVAAWWNDDEPVIIDPVLCDRAAFRENAPDRDIDAEKYLPNAKAMVTVADHIGKALRKQVDEAAHMPLVPRTPDIYWNKPRPRGDLWIDWGVKGQYGLAVRLWLNSRGMAIGLRPFPDAEAGATERAVDYLNRHPVPGYRILSGKRSRTGEDVGFVGGGTGEVIYGRWYDRDDFDHLDIAALVTECAREVAPAITGMLAEQQDAQDPGARALESALATLVEEFRTETGFPTADYERDQADRAFFADLLARENLPVSDIGELRLIWNTGRYGGTGPMPTLNISVRDADETEYRRIIDTFDYLCWGADDPEVRIDRVLTEDEWKVKGFGESVMMKMLAICEPDRFITVYPLEGSKGKLKMLRLLGIDEPEGSAGAKQVAANDALRAHLRPYFPDDPLGMGTFLYWLADRDTADDVKTADATVDTVDPLDTLAEELLVDRAFIDDIVALLERKGQVVFYGPPGTGKTYFARKLAAALTSREERRPIVQFHPSTSYEDFFEGYRPETDTAGAMIYRLQKGPLADLADRAAEAPHRRHVMVIDEINRANLPKVLGELLFLLEYRDTAIRTLYRPDEPFELPENIWFIGTMNTADRSIALIDAAMRRRFHFVPFFPENGAMKDLLGRWLAREGEPEWVGRLVSGVNAELAEALGGPDLQLGASHFMQSGLDVDALERIWRYDIEPFIEDQFFGDADRIEFFRFPQVYGRFIDASAPVADDIDDDAQ